MRVRLSTTKATFSADCDQSGADVQTAFANAGITPEQPLQLSDGELLDATRKLCDSLAKCDFSLVVLKRGDDACDLVFRRTQAQPCDPTSGVKP